MTIKSDLIRLYLTKEDRMEHRDTHSTKLSLIMKVMEPLSMLMFNLREREELKIPLVISKLPDGLIPQTLIKSQKSQKVLSPLLCGTPLY
jgi:hypothetical protein